MQAGKARGDVIGSQTSSRASISSVHIVFIVAAVALLLLVLYPVAKLILLSFDLGGDPRQWLDPWLQQLRRSRVRTALLNTITIPALTVIFAVVLGAGLAWIVERTNAPLKRLLASMAVLPFLMMPLIGALAWSFLAAPQSGAINVALRYLLPGALETGPININSHLGIAWVMGLYYTPYLYLFVSAALRTVSPDVEEASVMSGASVARTTWSITLPLVMPAILSGALTVFILSAGQFAIPAILGSPRGVEVLSTLIFESMNRWPVDMQQVGVVASLLLGMCVLLVLIQRRMIGDREYTAISGKGLRSRTLDLGLFRWIATGLGLAYLLFAVVLPSLALVWASLTPYWSAALDLSRLTLSPYISVLFERPTTLNSVKNSFILSIVSATIAILLAAVIGYMIYRSKMRGRGALELLSMAPIAIPAIVFAVGVLEAWIRPPLVLYGSMAILVVAYVGHSLPIALRSLTGSMLQVSGDLEESARMSGAGWLTTVRTVIMPLIRPGIMAGWLLLFVTFMRELGSSILLYSPGSEVISVEMFTLWEAGRASELAALSVGVVVISLVAFMLSQALGAKSIGGSDG